MNGPLPIRHFALATLVATLCVTTHAQRNYPPSIDDAREETYKSVDGVDLKLWIFEPDGHSSDDQRPAAVFFFGGGWKAGSPEQFVEHCEYLASRGMVAMTADYRVRTRHENLADRCVADAKSAIRWVRSNAKRLGVDPNRIVAGGGSAGGHIAACTGIIDGLDEPDENLKVSSRPNAMALFNPAMLLARYGNLTLDEEKLADIATRTGVPPEQISPIHQLKGLMPPAIIFHGTNDDAVPYETVKAFAELAVEKNNRCELMTFEGDGHGFFNYGRDGTPGENFLRTMVQMDRFLVSLGYLQGESTIRTPTSPNVHLRSHIDNSRIKFERDKKGCVAFIGGSITEMNGYRPMVIDYLQKRFPNTEFTFVSAGISSTCSTTGAFRLTRDVLSKNPDLFFIEFAVNDDQDAAHAARECVRGMEGIVRHVRQTNPYTDMVVTHFVNPGMLAKLQAGEQPISSAQHERVAKRYGVATSYLAQELADRINAGTMTWKEFGGTHPKKPGNRLAADLIIDLLETAWADSLGDAQPTKHANPKPIDKHSYFTGEFVAVNTAELNEGWEVKRPNWESLPGGKRARYNDLDVLCADQPGSECKLAFRGNAIGAFVLAGPDAGTVEYSVDDGEVEKLNLYHRFSKGLHYPRTVMFAAGLDAGDHELRIRVSTDKSSESKGHAIRIMEFAVNKTGNTASKAGKNTK